MTKHIIAITIVAGGAQVSCSACHFGRLCPSTARAKTVGAEHEAASKVPKPAPPQVEAEPTQPVMFTPWFGDWQPTWVVR